MRLLAIICFFSATAAMAQPVPRDTDTLLSKEDLTELVKGKMLEFYTGGYARYGADGRYDYRYELEGPPAPGEYTVMDDSRICTVFHNGFDRCDLVVKSGERIVFIIENGDRYPVREATALN